ncbi:MAG: TonB-dependent receptor [Gammaproteobacteria bacterium]|nr:TonB-dependent receptor [Gammaproteobacteria bacterium]
MFLMRTSSMICVSFALSWVAAAEEPAGTASRIEEVTVMATRVQQSIGDVPMAVSVIDQQDIQRGRQQLGLDESLNRAPGVFAQNRYNFAQDLRLAIRGFGARANFGIRGVKILADGIPATMADGQSGVDDIDLGSIRRIEVTRGPSSSLYGASSGGVINLFTEDGPDNAFVEAAATIGEYNQQKYQLKTGGQSGKLNYLASASRLTYDGYRDHSRVEATAFNSKFRYDIDAASDLTVVFNLVDSPMADDAGGITSDQVDADPRQAQPRNLSSNAGEELDQQKIGFIYNRELTDSSSVRVRNYYLWRDFSAFLPIGTHIPFVSDDGVVEFDRFFWGGGVQFSFDNELFGRPNQIITGVDVDIQEDDRQRYLNNAGVKGALAFDQLEKAEAFGVFVRNELSVTEQLRLIAGLRYDKVDLSVDDRFLANADQSSNLDFDEVNPMLGLVWDLGPGVSVYANYATSFETPTFTELASPARNLDVSLGGFNNVSAQQADSVELGLRGGFLEERLYVDIAAFSMQVDDEITSVSNIGSRSFFENADTDRKGIEVYAAAELAEGLSLTAAYTYSDFTFERFQTNPAFENNQLPGLPDHQLFAELEYNHTSGLYIAADLLYIEELQVNNANTASADSSTVASIRAGAALEFRQWQFNPFLGVNNLFDEDYIGNVRINGFGGRVFEPAPTRNVYGGVTIRYQPR